MSSIRIRELPEKVDNLDDDDLLIVEDKEDTKKITLIRLRSIFSMDGILTSMKNQLQKQIDSFVVSHSNKYKELESRNKDLEVICHNLQNDHDHDKQRIFELEDKLILHKQLSDNLEETRDYLNTVISSLENDKTILSDEVNQLKTTLSENEKSIIILKSQVKDLQLKSLELKSINNTLTNSLDELKNSSDTVINNEFTELNNTLKQNIDDLYKYIKYYHPDME